ncbi:hypothetical protein Q8A67_008831 [Cirrhinus molitorella]|uniref:Uncharacterized protein n=1 Tax=Cirrhinus molitorella TaxID=172907 RepID=A0AA88PXW5_9TELE|nr:hypothetical protein Q8A67_008831 [Cirrhinus molitorella]
MEFLKKFRKAKNVTPRTAVVFSALSRKNESKDDDALRAIKNIDPSSITHFKYSFTSVGVTARYHRGKLLEVLLTG